MPKGSGKPIPKVEVKKELPSDKGETLVGPYASFG